MKLLNVCAGVALCVATLSGAPAKAAVTMPITFVGGGFFTAVTSSCALVGFTAKQGFTVVYRPAANGQQPGLNLQFQLGSALLSTGSASFSGKQTFTAIGITDKAAPYSTQSGTSNLTIVTAGNGLSVTITGTIANLYGDPSCTLTVRSAATQRP